MGENGDGPRVGRLAQPGKIEVRLIWDPRTGQLAIESGAPTPTCYFILAMASNAILNRRPTADLAVGGGNAGGMPT